MEPAVIALVGVLLQVTLATDSSNTQSAKNLKPGDVDRVISSALRQLSAAVYNILPKDQTSSLEEVHFKFASLFNDLQEQCQTLSMGPNDLARLNAEARKILGTVLESMYGVRSSKGILASITHAPLRNISQPDPLAKLLDPVPGQGAESQKVREHTRESYTTNKLPCIVCQVKSINCSYENGLNSCEACRKSKIRCIKPMPSGQHCQTSLPSINTLVEDCDLGRRSTMQRRSVVDPTRDTGVAEPTHPDPTTYQRPALNCARCAKTGNCAWCPGSNGYRGYRYLPCELGRPTPNAPPPINNHRIHNSSSPLKEKPVILNGDRAVFTPLVNPSSGHHSAIKKRTMSASVAAQEDHDAIKRAKNIETSRNYQARMAREYEELVMGNEV